MCVYLQHHEDLGRGLYDVVKTTDMLVTQILHSLNLNLDTGQVILGSTESLLLVSDVSFLICSE